MIVEIAFAKDGFINCKQQIVDPTNKNNFVECLKSFLTFEQCDLLGFDGVHCTVEHDIDPTNSLFIFKNDTGEFLYQIQSATPLIHKNKLLWSCVVLQQDTISNIQNIIETNNSFIDLTNGIARNYSGNIIIKSKKKNNFKPKRILQFPFGAYPSTTTQHSIYTLKIKCYVDPTNRNLTSNSNDGSFVFLFPIRASSNYFSTQISNGTTTISLQTIISTYSNNIKTIEVLPFFANQAMVNVSTIGNYDIDFTNSTSEVLKITLGNGFTFTDLGLFLNGISTILPAPICKNAYIGKDFSFNSINRRLALGGGVSGFVRTPLGNFELDFENVPDSFYSGQDRGDIVGLPLDEGFAIIGNFFVMIPPHYLNFYTDSSGNIFINQQTSYQLENKNLILQREKSYEQAQLNFGSSILGNFGSGVAGLLSGNPFLSSTGVSGIFSSMTDFATSSIQSNIDFKYAQQELKNKISNETALAKLTGKHLSGNMCISNLLKHLGNVYFEIIIEQNYKQEEDNKFNVQTDFDYSTTFEDNDAFENFKIRNYQSYYLFERLQKIFGLNTDDNLFSNNFNAQYLFVFKIKNQQNNQQFTNDIILPIRF